MRLTKIICTIGPVTRSPEGIAKLIEAGMNIARVNFSHGNADDHKGTIEMIRKHNKEHGTSIAVLLDTKGAEIRTGDRETALEITEGQEVIFSSKEITDANLPVVLVNYDKFADDVRKAESILIENGALPFSVVSINNDGTVTGKALDSGSIGSRRHVNLPGADVSLPTLTEKDWADLRVGIEEKVDYVALSFIRTAKDVLDVREFLQKHKSDMQIVAKIETRQAVADIDAIIEASDGVMVARGDLGAEMPYEQIPAVQDMIVRRCREFAKPVIVATHMLESMIEHPMPTRAEVTDIAHAAVTRADCTMLSGETAAGKHPFAAVRSMSRILEETESHLPLETEHPARCELGERCALAEAAVSMADAFTSPVILVITKSGKTAQAVSMLRPKSLIVAFTEKEETCTSLQMWHGIKPMSATFEKDPDITLKNAIDQVRSMDVVPKGSKIVVISDAKRASGDQRSVHLASL